jgi:hypothetical protein
MMPVGYQASHDAHRLVLREINIYWLSLWDSGINRRKNFSRKVVIEVKIYVINLYYRS